MKNKKAIRIAQNRYFLPSFLLLLLFNISPAKAFHELKPRIVVLTDIAPGNVEPDDMESMVRLMVYAD